MTMTILSEGLKEGDLQDLVQPRISVDEYESKIDDSAIVVAFFVQDNDPAQDLNRFIQKSAVNLLDTDVSPAPDEDGFFLVFVEFMRDSAFPNKMVDVLSSLEGLTNIKPDAWKFKPYGHTDTFEVTADSLREQVDLEPNTEADEDDLDDLDEFFKPSLMSSLNVINEHVEMTRLGRTLVVKVLARGSAADVFEQLDLLRAPLRLDESARRGANQLRYYLGENWSIDQFGEAFVISHAQSETVLAVKL